MAVGWSLLGLLRLPGLLRGPGRQLWGEPDTDALTVPWTLWHVAWQLLHEGAIAGHTTMVAWPEGGTFWPASPIESLLLVPVTALAGAALAANLQALLHIGLAGGLTYALLRRMGAGWQAALGATPLMALSPVLLCSAHNGNPEVGQIYWLPLCALAAWEAARHPRAWASVAAGACLALAMIGNVYVGLAAGVVVLAMLALGRARPLRATLTVGAGVVLSSPVLAWAARLSSGAGSLLQRDAELVLRQRLLEGQASIAELVLPGAHYGLGPDLQPTTFLVGASLGLVASIACVVALAFPRLRPPPRTALVSLGMVLVGVLMALGPSLIVSARPAPEQAGLALPWALLDPLPPFSQLIELWRFVMVAHLGMALLLGLSLLGRSRWLALGLGLAVTLEVAVLSPGPAAWRLAPLPHAELGELFDGLDEGAVLHVPARMGFWPLYFQTLHQRPVAVSTERPLDVGLFTHLAGGGWCLRSLRDHARSRGQRWLVLHVREDMEQLQQVHALAEELEEAGLVTRSAPELLIVDLEQSGPWPCVDHKTQGRPDRGPGGPVMDMGRAPAIFREAPR